jgi:hypothetical protein
VISSSPLKLVGGDSTPVKICPNCRFKSDASDALDTGELVSERYDILRGFFVDVNHKKGQLLMV